MNRINKTVSIFYVIILIQAVSYATPVTLSFDISNIVSDKINVNVMISGLEDINLGAFVIDVKFDYPRLSPGLYELGEGLNPSYNSEADWSQKLQLQGTDWVYNLSEISLKADLSDQLSSFSLGNIPFFLDPWDAEKSYDFTFLNYFLSDDSGNSINSVIVQNGYYNVPELSTKLLVLLGLLGLFGIGIAQKLFLKFIQV
jgi:hypothetical protein